MTTLSNLSKLSILRCPLSQCKIDVKNVCYRRHVYTRTLNKEKSVRWLMKRHLYYASSHYCQSKQTASSAYITKLAEETLAAKIAQEGKEDFAKQLEADEKARREENERARRAVKYSFLVFGGITLVGGAVMIWRWGSPVQDDDGNIIPDEFSGLPILQQYCKRTYKELIAVNTMIQKPSREKLLPDPLSGQYYQPPYTLVLELKDVLVHPEWSYETGWRFKKRPGVDLLLQQCAPPLFEIVIYTNEQAFTAFPVIDKLDPNGYIWYRLFKDSTLYHEGKHMKELTSLNRDLKRVIMVDWDSDAVSCPRNQLRVPRWDGTMPDHGLLKLALMLQTIAERGVDDVRDVLDYYRQFDDPLEKFAEFHRATVDDEQQRLEEEKKRQAALAKAPVKQAEHWSPSFMKKWR